ncbi:MAG: hypothetical protein PVJ64_04150 [Gemmatimonadales bacterium]|jgi:hypothetical protein
MNATETDFQTGFLAERMGIPGTVFLGLYLLLLALVGTYALITIWPSSEGLESSGFFWGLFQISVPEDSDVRLILIAAIAGALGSFIHIATSYATYIGNRNLRRSWALWYVARPFIGMALALLVYLLVRGGLLAPSASTGDVNAHGVAGLSGLVGMFSKQASDKLKEVFDLVFTSKGDNERKDKISEVDG